MRPTLRTQFAGHVQEPAAISTPAAAPWPHQQAQRRARRTGFGLLAIAAFFIGAAWAIPPMLDWGRFRTGIAAFAGAELGHKVVIGGDVALRLFPQPTLTATDVTVPDGGDGMSARIASLRLEVDIVPLLAGRLIVHDLVLGSPALTLPWPLPASIIDPARPRIPHAFAAHVENGTVQAGQTQISGITAAIHGGSQPSEAPDSRPVATFGAEGFAAFDGQRWRFTTALGAPDADNVSPVDLTLQGLGPAQDTGATIQGTLSDGVLQGRLRAAGSDLSLLLPASGLAWRAEAPFIASSERIESTAVTLLLGHAPATAAFTLQLAAPTRFDGRISAGSLDLNGWSRLLSGKFAQISPPAIPIRLDISAGSASLLGGKVGALSGQLLFDGTHASAENVQALLPGNATLHFSGGIERGPGKTLSVNGPATLDAPDLHATLAWLRPLAPPLLDALPDAVLRTARLTGTVRLAPGRLSVRKMTGALDDDKMTGSFDVAFGAHPRLAASAAFDHLAIDPWLQDLPIRPGMKLEVAARPFTAVETDLHLTSATAGWAGHALTNLVLDAATGPGGLKIAKASVNLPDLTVSVSGSLAADGRIIDARARAATAHAENLLAALPPGWRLLPAIWKGQARFVASADGPPGALELQARAETSDLVFEADQHRNTADGSADTTLTLRHPGAPFLLETLGWSNAGSWLGQGSLTLLAHLHAVPGFTSLTDFALNAADMHLSGHGTLAYASGEPYLRLDVQSADLPLPSWSDLDATVWPWPLASLRTDLHLTAPSISIHGRPVADSISADLAVDQGNLFAQLTNARVGGGTLTAQAAIDTRRQPIAVALRGEIMKASIPGPLATQGFALNAGNADLDFDLTSSGTTATALQAGLSGSAQLFLRNTVIAGFDLPRLDTLFLAHAKPAPAALQQALSTGETTGLSGSADLTFDNGYATLTSASLSSTEGSISIAGKIDLPARTLDVSVGVTPAIPNIAPIVTKLAGPLADAKQVIDLGKFQVPPARPHRKRAIR